jgi:uncharacterized protein DUF4157
VAGPAHEHDREARGRAAEAAQEREEPGPVERLASGMGNRAFAALARDGAGILPDGKAHPDVEAAIAQTRGGGHSLADGARQRFSEGLGDSLEDVRVHTDDHADALSRSVQARAFTTGADVYFAKGEYQPGSTSGDRLLAHELSHVVQQRGAPASGPLEVSQPGDSHEVEAESVADELAG